METFESVVLPIKPVTQYRIDCPYGCRGDLDVGHLRHNHREPGFTDDQQCWRCHKYFSITVMDGTEVRVGPPQKDHSKRLMLLNYEGIVIALDKEYFRGPVSDANHLDYLIHEHTCPTNYLAHTETIIDIRVGDDDPHGIFRLIHEGIVPDDGREFNIDDLEHRDILRGALLEHGIPIPDWLSVLDAEPIKRKIELQ